MEEQLSPGEQEMSQLRAGGFGDDEIQSWQANTTQSLYKGGFSEDEVNNYFGKKKVDDSQMKDYVKKNVQGHIMYSQSHETPKASDWTEAFWTGVEGTSAGMWLRAAKPEMVMPENVDRSMRIANMVGDQFGSLPGYVAGGIVGGAAAGPVGAMAGGMAVEKGVRKILMDHYERGDINSPQEFADRFVSTAHETVKAGLIGAITAATGGAVAPVAGPLAAVGAEIATMTTAGAALENRLPTKDEFIDSAIVLGGLHMAGTVTPKLRNIYAATGEKPSEVIEAANTNIELKQELLSDNPNLPKQAEPTTLNHELVETSEPSADGTKGKKKFETKTELIPKELAPKEEVAKNPVEPTFTDNENYFLSKIGEQKEVSKDAPLMDKFHDLYARTLDRGAAIRRILDKAGIEPSETDSAAMMQMMSAHGDVTQGFIENGTRDFRTGEVNGEPYMNIVKDYRKDFPEDPQMKGLKAYGIAARTLELAERGKEIIVNGEHLDLEKAQALVDEHGEKYQKYLDRSVEFGNRGLQYMHDSGYWSSAQFKAMIDLNKQHFSFSRIMEPDQFTGKMPGSRGVKRINGDGGFFQDPIVSTLKNTNMMLQLAEENRVKTRFTQDLRVADEPEMWLERVSQKQSGVYITPREIEAGLMANGITPSENLTEGIKVFKADYQNLGEGQFSVMEDGKRVVYNTHPVVAEALNSMAGNPAASYVFSGVLKAFPAMLRLGTVNNPLFGARHAWRNQWTAPVLSQTGLKPFVDMFRYAPEFLSKGEDFQQALHEGAFVSNIVPIETDYVNGKIYDLNKDAPFLDRAWNTVKGVGALSHWAITLHDNMTRFAEYQRAGEQGKTPQEAAYLARNVLPDYQKAGIQKSAMLQLAAFAKVHYVSEAQAIAAFTKDPMGVSLRAMAYMTVPSLLLYAANQGDDRVNDQPNEMKNLYNMLALDKWEPANAEKVQAVQQYDPKLVRQKPDGSYEVNNGSILRMPVPFSLGVLFSRGPVAAIEAIRKKDPKIIEDWVKGLGASFVANIVPTAAVPVVEQAFNYNFFTHKPLVSSFAEKELPELQQTPYTSEVAKQVSQAIHSVAVLRNTVGKIGPGDRTLENPVILDNYMQAWGGTLGQYVVKTLDKGLHTAGIGDLTTKPEMTWAETPFVKEFLLRTPSTKIEAINDFYEKYDKSKQVAASFQLAAKTGDQEKLDYIQKNYGDQMHSLDGIAEALHNHMVAISQITKDKEMTAHDKTQLIENLMYGLMATAKQGNKEADALKADNKEGN